MKAATALVEAQKFINRYEQVGWVVGKACQPMKSWPGAASTWFTNWSQWQNEKAATANGHKVDTWKCFVCDKEIKQDDKRSHMDMHQAERQAR